MYDLLHRYAPRSPAGRIVLAILATSIAVPTTIQGIWELTRDVPAAPPYLLVGAVLFAIAACLTVGVVRQANAAPDSASPVDRSTSTRSVSARSADADPGDRRETPIETLRDRYAAGELTDDEFQRRLDRLLETEGIGRTESGSEPPRRTGSETNSVLEPTTADSSRDADTERV